MADHAGEIVAEIGVVLAHEVLRLDLEFESSDLLQRQIQKTQNTVLLCPILKVRCYFRPLIPKFLNQLQQLAHLLLRPLRFWLRFRHFPVFLSLSIVEFFLNGHFDEVIVTEDDGEVAL